MAETRGQITFWNREWFWNLGKKHKGESNIANACLEKDFAVWISEAYSLREKYLVKNWDLKVSALSEFVKLWTQVHRCLLRKTYFAITIDLDDKGRPHYLIRKGQNKTQRNRRRRKGKHEKRLRKQQRIEN